MCPSGSGRTQNLPVTQDSLPEDRHYCPSEADWCGCGLLLVCQAGCLNQSKSSEYVSCCVVCAAQRRRTRICGLAAQNHVEMINCLKPGLLCHIHCASYCSRIATRICVSKNIRDACCDLFPLRIPMLMLALVKSGWIL